MHLSVLRCALLNSTYLLVTLTIRRQSHYTITRLRCQEFFYNFFIFFITIICYYFVTKMAKGVFSKVGYIIVTICYHFVIKTAKGVFGKVGYNLVTFYHYFVTICHCNYFVTICYNFVTYYG